MARVRKPSKNDVIEMENKLQDDNDFIREPGHTIIDLEEEMKPTLGQDRKRLGGHSGGDFDGGGKGPAIGETHDSDEETADHYGSPEETQAALEGKIASQNTLKLHHF
jgi:hypothetical protein